MKIQQYEDNEIERIASANLDAALLDLAQGPAELEKHLSDFHAAQQVDHVFDQLEEELALIACTGRSGPAPRLRSERAADEPEWRPGMDPNIGLEPDGEPLEKRYKGKLTKTVSASGWTTERNEAGEIVRAYGPGVDQSVFDRIQR